MKENLISSTHGLLALGCCLVVGLLGGALFLLGGQTQTFLMSFMGMALAGVAFFATKGLYMVEPNQSVVLSLFGDYVGTVKDTGLRWNNPFYSKHKVSRRIRNFESGKLKVNELGGSPIEIASVIVWQVTDASEAVFNVDDVENFVHIQAEAAVRALATSYPYDSHDDETHALRSHANEVAEHLKKELSHKLQDAGVRVIDARISHLAYAPEIAQAMLQRQQADAIIAARTRIVAGACGMVEMALAELEKSGTVSLNDEQKAQMVSNLLVVLCSDRSTQPVVNTSAG